MQQKTLLVIFGLKIHYRRVSNMDFFMLFFSIIKKSVFTMLGFSLPGIIVSVMANHIVSSYRILQDTSRALLHSKRPKTI